MKKIQTPPLVLEIKKKYLLEHLDEVKKLIETWIGELRAPLPFSRERHFELESVYSPASEVDPDRNHILRHHLKSRALWNHHTNWQRSLENIFQLISEIRTRAEELLLEMPLAEKRDYTEDYLGTALWKAFALTREKKFELNYTIPKGREGVALGAYLIELSASTLEELNMVIHQHKALVESISSKTGMELLLAEFFRAEDLEGKMQKIASTALASNNIIYPCKFCKYLWK